MIETGLRHTLPVNHFVLAVAHAGGSDFVCKVLDASIQPIAADAIPVYFLRSSDKGETWAAVAASATTVNSWFGQDCFRGDGQGNLYDMSRDWQKVLKSTDFGATWSAVLDGTADPLDEFEFFPIAAEGNTVVAPAILYTTSEIRLYVSTDAGATWGTPAVHPAALGPYMDSAGIHNGTIIVTLDEGDRTILRSTDAGANWTSTTVEYTDWAVVSGHSGVWFLSPVLDLAMPHPRTSLGMYCSTDDGVTWEYQPSYMLSTMDVKGPYHMRWHNGVWAAVANGVDIAESRKLIYSENNGETWHLAAGVTVSSEWIGFEDAIGSTTGTQESATLASDGDQICVLTDKRLIYTSNDFTRWHPAIIYDDAAQGADAVTTRLGLALADVAQAATTLQTFWQTSESLADVGAAVDTLRTALVLTLSDSAEASAEIKFAYGVALLDILRGQDTTQTFYHALQSLADTLSAQDTLVGADVEQVEDSAQAADEALAFLHMLATLADAAETDTSFALLDHTFVNLADAGTVEDASQALRHLLATAEDTAEAGDETASLRHLIAEVRDVGEAWVVFKLGEESYVGWAMNTDGAKPISEYQGFNFNSFAEIGGKYYGATDEGLYLLEGEDDAGTPIDASIKTMMIDFRSSRMKRVRAAYLGYTSDGRLIMRVKAVTVGKLEEHWFEATPRNAEAPREQIVKLGRGLESRYWQFELVNVDGSDFEIDKMEFYPVILSRRS